MIDSLPSGCSLLGVEDSRSNIFNVTNTCNIVDDLFSASMGMLFTSGISRDTDSLGFSFLTSKIEAARPAHQPSESPAQQSMPASQPAIEAVVCPSAASSGAAHPATEDQAAQAASLGAARLSGEVMKIGCVVFLCYYMARMSENIK